jgi:hypothetical protein
MNAAAPPPMAFNPKLAAADPLAASWLAEITLRLRREICWLWYQRAGVQGDTGARLPPLGDATADSLDLTRFADEKRRMFDTDVSARYLTEQIALLRQTRKDSPGPWSTIAHRLELDDAAQLVLALGLIARADAACASILGACHDNPARTLPTLALAQRLCDEPGALLALDAAHRLFRFGLLCLHADGSASDWNKAFEIMPPIATACLLIDGGVPAELRLLTADEAGTTPRHAAGLLHGAPGAAQFVPLLGDTGTDFVQWAAALAQASGRHIVEFTHGTLPGPARLPVLAAWCWLYDVDVLLPPLALPADDHQAERPAWPAVPLRWLAPMHELRAGRQLPAHALQPPLQLPQTGFDTRVARFKRALGARAQGLDAAIEEMARRFRVGPAVIDAVGHAAAALDGPLNGDQLSALCRAQTRPDLGSLAQPVKPRFTLGELVLPPSHMLQLTEIVRAMRALTRVHYHWGTARAWNDAGLSVLFCGPPGTGKTMAAEALADELQLPMFRIDLSQVVNKYIGETEKNLKRVFDAAEESDCLIFFDEADALFGKRTSVKDAHDRFANIEISYLLERMERLKGIAVLATNRRKDLDEAFLRRLRYLVEFPLPGAAERERLWRYVFPSAVDTSALDFAFLARMFPLAGGHIRSIALNACLQSEAGDAPRIGMQAVLCAVKRELDKLNRPTSVESFGEYHAMVQPLFSGASK